MPDDQAIDAVWGDLPPDSVAAALRVHVTHARRAVHPIGWGVSRAHHGYVLTGGPFQLDVRALDAVEAEANNSDDLGIALAASDQGLALWRGPSLADLRRFPLGERLAAGFDRRYENLLDRRLELLLKVGRAREALPPLHRLVREDPLNEGRWGLFAEALYRSGHQAEALEALAQARSSLEEKVGLLPGPALRELQRRILNHDLEQVPPVPPANTYRRRAGVPKALAAQAPERLVGRAAELAGLTELLEGPCNSSASTVVRIHGESGIGKSALAAHLAREADRRGMRVLYGWAERDAPRPLGLLAEPLAELLAALPELRASEPARALERVLGWRLLDSSDSPVLEGTQPSAGRAQVIDAVRRVLDADQRRRGLVIVVDDAQWADELSLAVLRSVARYPVTTALVLVVIERSATTSVVAGRGVSEFELTPLTESDIAAWAGCPEDEWTGRLLEATGGLPLLVEDVLRRTRVGTGPPQLTDSVGRRLLQERLAELSASCANTLLGAAVLGSSFRFDNMVALSGRSELKVLEDLDSAARAGILTYDHTDSEVFRFAHDLLRRATLDNISPLRRMRLHAEVLDAVTDLPPVVAGNHALSAGRFLAPERLAGFGLRASRSLLETFGFQSARSIVERTMKGTAGRLDHSQRALLLTALARAEAALNEPLQARGHLGEAAEAASLAGTPEVLAEVVLAEDLFGQEHAQYSDAPDRLIAVLQQVSATALETRFQLTRRLAFVHVNGGRLDEAATVLGAAKQLARELGTASAEAHCLYVEYLLCEFAGDVPPRAALVARAGALVAAHKDGRLNASYLGMSVVQHLQGGEFDEADSRALELAELGDRTGDPYSEWMGLAARFSAPFLSGDLAAAHAAAQQAYARGSQNEIFGAAGAYSGQLFCLAWVTGGLDSAPQPTEAPDLAGHQLAWRALRALALALLRQREAALVELRGAQELIPSVGAQWIGFIGLALAVEAAAALEHREVLTLAVPILRRRRYDHVILGMGVIDLGPVARYLALALHGLDRREEALGLLATVHADPTSGTIWQLRAAHDLAVMGVAPAGWRLPAGGMPWAWLLPGGPERRF